MPIYLRLSNAQWNYKYDTSDEIHQPLISHFPLLVKLFIGKVPVYNKDSKVLRGRFHLRYKLGMTIEIMQLEVV